MLSSTTWTRPFLAIALAGLIAGAGCGRAARDAADSGETGNGDAADTGDGGNSDAAETGEVPDAGSPDGNGELVDGGDGGPFDGDAADGAPPDSAGPPTCPTEIALSPDWKLTLTDDDASFPDRMSVTVGACARTVARLAISHTAQTSSGQPQVIVINASGYVRLKQNADPSPPIPFGTSFVLGPAYWETPRDGGGSLYRHNPSLSGLTVDASWLPAGALRMEAAGRNGAFDVSYSLSIPAPLDRRTQMHVAQRYTAREAVNVDPGRQGAREGFKLVQGSSLYIDGACNGGSQCHDSDAIRFQGDDLAVHTVAYAQRPPNVFLLASPIALGSTWLDILHSDDLGWQGDTPNVRITLDELSPARPTSVQGYVVATADPNDDNVGIWLSDDQAPAIWAPGDSGETGYWLSAEDNPPDAWRELGLRTGLVFEDFEGGTRCTPINAVGTTGSIAAIDGVAGKASQLSYDLGSASNAWAQISCDFAPHLDLSAYDHFRFDWRGDAAAPNSLELVVGSGSNLVIRQFRHVTQRSWWGQIVVPFASLGSDFNPADVGKVAVSVVNVDAADQGGKGRLAIDNLSAVALRARATPAAFETAARDAQAADDALAGAIAAQMHPTTRLARSWREDGAPLAHMYDQAIALIVLSDAGRAAQARDLAAAIASLQEADGSWYQSYRQDTTVAVTTSKWEGDIGWVDYALSRYVAANPGDMAALLARDRGAAWLAARADAGATCPLRLDDSALSTEGAIDLWWALRWVPRHSQELQKIQDCLLGDRWDDDMGRFKGSRDDHQPFLDNQTWGAAFLKAIGRPADARRALGYARFTLLAPSRGGNLSGFDGNAGPWAVWNEGTLQYAAVGGAGAGELLAMTAAQAESPALVRGAPDDFLGGGVWTSRWHGVAPTAWLYFALNGEPFMLPP